MATNHSQTNGNHSLNNRQVNIPLDFSSVQTLPDSHAWPQSNNDQTRDGVGSSIPIIDLTDPNAMQLIGHACENWGAFQLKNHGIPLSVIEDVEVETKRLFDAPMEQKLKALRSIDNPTGYGTVWISSSFAKYMWQEGFTITGSPTNDAQKIWPDDYERFCDVMENLEKHMTVLVEKLINMVFNFLGISEEEKKWVGSNNHKGAIQLNSYPPCPEPNRAMGMAPHTDTSIFTVLHQTQSSGLQILDEVVRGWVTVPLDPTTLIVHTGDLLHIMSNARFKSAMHRVVVNETRHRYSMAFFYRPTMDRVVSPLVLHSEARFRALTLEEYVGIKDKNLGEALSLIST